jgi:peptidoglycan/LPS O-acetylase OafA/YrhL
MSKKHDSILDHGYWESSRPAIKLSLASRVVFSVKGILDKFRPAILANSNLSRKPRRTAYLDGLRGFAALMVYFGHHQVWSKKSAKGEEILQNGFGYSNEYYFCRFPGIRTLFSGGHFAVCVFFVISGYALSTKPLSLIQSGEFTLLGDNLAGALFRRFMRLHIPVICSTFVYMTSWHAFGIWTDHEHKGSYRDELWNWYVEFKNFSFVFRTGGESWFTYDFHVWSIPVEFRGSIVIYTALMAFSRFKRDARLLCEIALIFYFMYIVDGWFASMFMAGMLLCDLDLLAENNKLPRFLLQFENYKELIYLNLFVFSVYLGGVPSNSLDLQVLRDTPGWYYLSFLKPQAVFDFKWFYLFWAATFLVVSIPRLSWLRSFFEIRFNQYLGRISFAFYLCHGPLLWTLGDRLYTATGWARESHLLAIPSWINIFPLSKAGPYGLEPAYLVPHLIMLPLTLWAAEIVTKFVDEPSVKFSQWLYRKSSAPSIKL